MKTLAHVQTANLICRIGSLENEVMEEVRHVALICRIGSLEIEEWSDMKVGKLICRIGSLEKSGLQPPYSNAPYLPHRQLRKEHIGVGQRGNLLSAA